MPSIIGLINLAVNSSNYNLLKKAPNFINQFKLIYVCDEHL